MPAEDADGINGPQLAAPVAEGAVVVLADQLERRAQKESFLWRVRDLQAHAEIRNLVLCPCVYKYILCSTYLDNRMHFLPCPSPGRCAQRRRETHAIRGEDLVFPTTYRGMDFGAALGQRDLSTSFEVMNATIAKEGNGCWVCQVP